MCSRCREDSTLQWVINETNKNQVKSIKLVNKLIHSSCLLCQNFVLVTKGITKNPKKNLNRCFLARARTPRMISSVQQTGQQVLEAETVNNKLLSRQQFHNETLKDLLSYRRLTVNEIASLTRETLIWLQNMHNFRSTSPKNIRFTNIWIRKWPNKHLQSRVLDSTGSWLKLKALHQDHINVFHPNKKLDYSALIPIWLLGSFFMMQCICHFVNLLK